MPNFQVSNAEIDLANIPGDYLEVWGNAETGEIHIVWEVPGGDGELMYWTVPSLEDYQSMLGPDQAVRVNRQVTDRDLRNLYDFGSSIELVNKAKHPFEAWLDQLETQAEVTPWILEPDAVALLAQAQLEGREVTEAEWRTTEWWQNHNAAEREWLTLYYGDPSTATQALEDATLEAAQLLREAGVSNAPESLAQLIGNNITTGTWSAAYVREQIRLLSSGAAPAQLDQEIVRIIGGEDGLSELDQSQDQIESVRGLVRQWLGPAHSEGWSEADYQRWAARFRDEADAEETLTDLLRSQRKAILPEYTDEDLTYEDIAGPWRQVWQSALGETADESDGDFIKIMRANDIDYANRLLRQRGIDRNNGNVVNNLLADLGGTFQSVRRSAI